METNYEVDASRRFIISYYLSDDTVAVFEPPVRNSGVIGGKFLERAQDWEKIKFFHYFLSIIPQKIVKQLE